MERGQDFDGQPPLRVLVVTNMWPTAAQAHHGIFVHDHVQALRAAGAEVDVFPVDTSEGTRAYLTAVPALRRRLRAGNFDVINAHHTYCVVQLALAGARGRSAGPIVLTCHEAEVFAPAGFREPGGRLSRRLIYWAGLKRAVFRLADELVCVHPDLAHLAGPGRPVAVIPPGINVQRYQPGDQAQARARLGLPQDGPVLLFPGDAARPQKGADLFRAALDVLSAKGIAPHVVLGGSLAPADMPAYCNSADVVVQTSVYEASPMVIKEAMACNRPVVSTDVGDVADLTAGLAGHWVVPPQPEAVADAIEKAMAFDGPTNGRRRVLDRGLSLEATAARYLDLLQRAVDSKGQATTTNIAVVRHGPFYADPRVTKQTLALAESGARVTVMCRGGDVAAWCEPPNLDVVRVSSGPASESPPLLAVQSLWFGLRVLARLLRRGPDVVVVHSIPSWLVLLLAPLRLRGKTRIVLDHHEPEAEMVQEAGAPGPLVTATAALERLAVRTADAVVAVSAAMAERSARLGARTQLVVDNAPRLHVPPATEADAEPTWGLAVFGSLIPRYDLDTMAMALADVGAPVDVLQIGRGPARLEANPSGGRFESLGYLPPPDLQARLVQCRFGFVGLKPTAFTDLVSPNRLWELVGLGVPGVVADTALLRDLLGPYAIFYPGGSPEGLAAAVRKAVELSEDERKAMADGARLRMHDRSWSAQAESFVRFCLAPTPGTSRP
ncbi:MAG: teichuronic acid biosynthesis glycosyltransferase TuaC [Acidimicrobiaceae bacterium]|nr:teichuronic acid biosynthesis glycosyltransferase TuaC [Acidimicrobiaceae bacterium]